MVRREEGVGFISSEERRGKGRVLDGLCFALPLKFAVWSRLGGERGRADSCT